MVMVEKSSNPAKGAGAFQFASAGLLGTGCGARIRTAVWAGRQEYGQNRALVRVGTGGEADAAALRSALRGLSM